MRYHHCFVGVPLPESEITRLRDVQHQLKELEPDFKVEDTPFPHVTLFFLGNHTKYQLGKAAKIIRESADSFSSITLEASKIECFSLSMNKPVYLEIVQNTEFENARKLLADLLIEFNQRGYRPSSHLTLGRLEKIVNRKELAHVIRTFNLQTQKTSFKFKISEIFIVGRKVGSKNSPQIKLFSLKI